jgi:hypothetical protein
LRALSQQVCKKPETGHEHNNNARGAVTSPGVEESMV